ncbi:MAG: hypothetical protein VCC02_05870 [Myxococcota bacterium]
MLRFYSLTHTRVNPELTLRVYAHAMKEEETDLSFLDFSGPNGTPAAPRPRRPPERKSPAA